MEKVINQPQNPELSRSSGGRGSDELRPAGRQDQVGLPQTKHQRLTTMEDMDYVHYSQ